MAFNNLSYRDISSHTVAAVRNVQEIGRGTDTHFVAYLLGIFYTTYLRLSEGRLRTKVNCRGDNMKYSLIRIQQYTFTSNKLNNTFNRTQR